MAAQNVDVTPTQTTYLSTLSETDWKIEEITDAVEKVQIQLIFLFYIY